MGHDPPALKVNVVHLVVHYGSTGVVFLDAVDTGHTVDDNMDAVDTEDMVDDTLAVEDNRRPGEVVSAAMEPIEDFQVDIADKELEKGASWAAPEHWDEVVDLGAPVNQDVPANPDAPEILNALENQDEVASDD